MLTKRDLKVLGIVNGILILLFIVGVIHETLNYSARHPEFNGEGQWTCSAGYRDNQMRGAWRCEQWTRKNARKDLWQ